MAYLTCQGFLYRQPVEITVSLSAVTTQPVGAYLVDIGWFDQSICLTEWEGYKNRKREEDDGSRPLLGSHPTHLAKSEIIG